MPPDDAPPTADLLLAETAWIAGLARSLVVDPGTAEDVAQDAAVVAFTRAPAEVASPRGWLRRVVGRIASNARRTNARRAAREITAAAPEPADAPDEIVARWEIRRRVVEAVLALDEPYRATILARYFDGLPAAEAAARLGVPLETLRTRTRRGLDLLRGRLATLDDGRGGRGVAAVVWLVGAEGEPALRLGRGAGAASAGGLLMAAATKWTLATAAVLLLGIGVVWTMRSDEAPPTDVAAGGDPQPDTSTPSRPRASRGTGETAAAAGEVPAGTGGAGAVNLDACDRERDLFGVVVDGEGKPVAGATVTALRNDAYRNRVPDLRTLFVEEPLMSTRTAADGTFALRLAPAAGVGLRAEADGLASWESWDRQAGERVRIVLGPAVALTVKVRREDGAPVAGASVRILGSPRDDPMVRKHGTTDAAGILGFRGVPRSVRGSLMLLVEPTGHGPAIQQPAKLGDAPEQTVEVVVPAGRDLTGRLVDAATDAPVRGGTVGSQQVHLAAIAAAEDGTFTYRGFTGANPTLSAKAPGYAQAIVRVPSDASEIRVRMVPGTAATGRVVDVQGAPVGGADVSLFAMTRFDGEAQASLGSATTGADGTFRVADLFGGVPHVLAVRASGRGTIRREVEFAATPGKDVALGDLVVGVARRVRVTTVGADDAPAPREEVTLLYGEFQAAQGLGNGEVRRTDDLGRATFGDVPPGSYVVRSGRDGPEARVEVGDADPAPVVLRVGGPASAAPAAPPAAGELVVTVVDDAGAPVTGASVRVDFDRAAPVAVPSGGDGVARIPCPAAPIRAIALVGSPYLTDPLGIDVAAGQRDVRIVLRRGVSISGRVLDAEGNPVSGSYVSAYGPAGAMYAGGPTAADGAFSVAVAPDAPVDLEVLRAPGSGPRQGPFPSAWRRGVRPGTEGVELRLAVPGGTTSLRVRVVDPEDAPIGGVAILVNTLGSGRFLRATTGDDGTAVVQDVPRAPATVMTFPHDSAPAILAFAPPRAARVVAGEDEAVVLRALAAVHIRGRVLGPDGAPVRGEQLTAHGADGHFGSAQTADDGTFDLLVPAGADPRWLLQCSIILRSARNSSVGNLVGTAVVRAPADGVEIHCSLAR